MKKTSKDENVKNGRGEQGNKPGSQVSRSALLGNLATVGIATTAAALLDVGHAHGQQVAQPVEAMEETSAGTVDAGRKVRTMPRHGQLKPEKLLVKNGAQDGDYKVREV